MSNRFQVGGCPLLGFKPRLALHLKGSTAARGHPQLNAVLTGRPGDANISYTQVTLPRAEILDQSNIRTVCTRVQFAADTCPPSSDLRHTRGRSRRCSNSRSKAPCTCAPPATAAGPGRRISTARSRSTSSAASAAAKGGGLRTTFDVVPDAPVSEFSLSMKGGTRRIARRTASTSAVEKQHADVLIEAHNGKTADQTPQLKVRGCGKARKKRSKRGHR